MTPRLTAYKVIDSPPPLVPGVPERNWMDRLDKFAYRCLPLAAANTTGWQLLCPLSFVAHWNGGPLASDITITPIDGSPEDDLHGVVDSQFGSGILTFHPGYLFRTDPGWGLLVRGAPNAPRDGIVPLDGLVETDWLPFVFTMNWQFTRPGSAVFMKGDPFCFIMPFRHLELDAMMPEIKPLESDPDLADQHRAWSQSRHEFNTRLLAGDAAALREQWQGHYMRGSLDPAAPPAPTHVARRRLHKPLVSD